MKLFKITNLFILLITLGVMGCEGDPPKGSSTEEGSGVPSSAAKSEVPVILPEEVKKHFSIMEGYEASDVFPFSLQDISVFKVDDIEFENIKPIELKLVDPKGTGDFIGISGKFQLQDSTRLAKIRVGVYTIWINPGSLALLVTLDQWGKVVKVDVKLDDGSIIPSTDAPPDISEIADGLASTVNATPNLNNMAYTFVVRTWLHNKLGGISVPLDEGGVNVEIIREKPGLASAQPPAQNSIPEPTQTGAVASASTPSTTPYSTPPPQSAGTSTTSTSSSSPAEAARGAWDRYTFNFGTRIRGQTITPCPLPHPYKIEVSGPGTFWAVTSSPFSISPSVHVLEDGEHAEFIIFVNCQQIADFVARYPASDTQYKFWKLTENRSSVTKISEGRIVINLTVEGGTSSPPVAPYKE